MPQAPQLALSLSMFLHTPPQSTVGEMHETVPMVQAPAEQIMPEGHALPQRPQLRASRCVSVQVVPQRV